MVFAADSGGQKRKQRRREWRRQRSGEQNAEPGLRSDGADVAAGTQQDGVHTHGVCCIARHHVQCAPPPRVHLLPGPGEHAPRRWFSTVRQIRCILFFHILSTSTPHCSRFSSPFLYSVGPCISWVFLSLPYMYAPSLSLSLSVCVKWFVNWGLGWEGSREASWQNGEWGHFCHFVPHCKFQTFHIWFIWYM